jgi:hypothetical protein
MLRSYNSVLRRGTNQNSLSFLPCWKKRWDDILKALKIDILAFWLKIAYR